MMCKLKLGLDCSSLSIFRGCYLLYGLKRWIDLVACDDLVLQLGVLFLQIRLQNAALTSE